MPLDLDSHPDYCTFINPTGEAHEHQGTVQSTGKTILEATVLANGTSFKAVQGQAPFASRAPARKRAKMLVPSFKLLSLLGLSLSVTTSAAADGFTTKHEAGRCAIRGHCGKQGFFGSELPCPDNGLAEKPAADVRAKLVGICGEKWSQGNVCCREEQVRSLLSNGDMSHRRDD